MRLVLVAILATGLMSLPALARHKRSHEARMEVAPTPSPRPPVTYAPRKFAFPGGVGAQFDIAYSSPAGLAPLTLDIYAPPPSASPPPIVLYVHGGGWDSGDSRHALPFTDFPRALASLAAQGYVVASINYRPSQQAHFPAALQDVKAAIRWMRGHASEYGADPTRLAVWGMSAGAQLAAMAGTSCGVTRFEPDGNAGFNAPSDCAEAVIDWFGPTDLESMGAGNTQPANDVPIAPASEAGLYRAVCAAGLSRQLGTLDAELYFGEPGDPLGPVAAGVPDRADLAILARRGDLRPDSAGRAHVLAGRARTLLSVDDLRLCRSGSGDSSA